MTSRRTMLIAGAAALAVLVVWYLVLWSPRKAELSDAREERVDAEAKRQELATRVSRLRASQKDEPIKRAQVEALRTTIPDDPNLAAFILDTNDAATKAGIDWISVSPAEPAAPQPTRASVAAAPVNGSATGTSTTAVPKSAYPAEISLQLQIEGGYFQVLDFLNRLHDMPRLVVTDSLNMSSDDDARLTVAVQGRMFVRTVPPGFGDVPANLPVSTTPATTAPAAGATVPAPATATPPPTATAAPAGTASTTGARS